MQVSKNSWHYKAYRFSYLMLTRDPPEQTNLCQYVQRLCSIPVMMIPIAIIYLMVMIIFPMIHITSWIGGSYYRTFVPNDFEEEKYKGIPFFGRYLYPWHFLVLTFLIAVHWYCGKRYGYSYLWYEGAAIAIIGIIVWFNRAKRNDTVSLIKNYLSAKKQGVCPLVEFKADDQPK